MFRMFYSQQTAEIRNFEFEDIVAQSTVFDSFQFEKETREKARW